MPERLQRLRLAATAVQREHPLAMQPLAQRVRADQLVELAQHRRVAALGQLGVDLGLARAQPKVLEPPDLGRGERLVGEIVKRRTTPQRQRLTHVRPVLARRHQALEVQRVDSVRVQAQLVATPARDDLRVGTRQLLAQLRDEHLHQLRSRGRRPFAPQPLDQPVGRNRGVGVKRQHRQQPTRLGAAQRQGATIVGRLDQTQNADFHGYLRSAPA